MDFILHYFLLQLIVEAAFSSNNVKSYKNYKLYQVRGDKELKENLVAYIKLLDNELVYEEYGNRLEMLVSPKLAADFQVATKQRKLETHVVIKDFSEIISTEKQKPVRGGNKFSWYAYYDVDEIYGYLEKMSKTYPNSSKLIVGGQSYEGRMLLGLRINTPSERRRKPTFFIESGIHAREWITPATTTYFINQLLTSSDPKIIAMRDAFDWHIFPTVNPDGYHYSYTFLAIHGKQFSIRLRRTRLLLTAKYFTINKERTAKLRPGADWQNPRIVCGGRLGQSLQTAATAQTPIGTGTTTEHGATNNKCDYQTYGGSEPFSEVETRSLSKYIASLENLQAYIAFHADAQCLLLTYSDSEKHLDNYDDMVKIGNTSLAYGYAVNKAKYGGPATAAEILYKASGGSMDWVKNAMGTPIVGTYELRGRYFHWPPWRISEQGEEVTQMMLGLVTEAKNLGYFEIM